jgi:hypothetical protein
MRSLFKQFLVVVVFVSVTGCATMEDRWSWAKHTNTVESYENFVKNYPHSSYVSDAKRCHEDLREEEAFKTAEAENSIIAYKDFIQKYPKGMFTEIAQKKANASDVEAFGWTCQKGTILAFQGFVKSYPKSKYLQIASDRIEFLQVIKPENLDSYRQFIIQYPNNPFVIEAKATIPVLWLCELRERIGLIINVEKVVKWKGIFKGRSTKGEIRQEIFDKLKKDYEKQGIQWELIDSLKDPKSNDVSTIVVMTYEEEKGPPKSSSDRYGQVGSPGLTGYTAYSLNKAATDNLATVMGSLLTGPSVNVSYRIDIVDAKTDKKYYSNISSLYSYTDNIQMVNGLNRFKNVDTIPVLLVALNSNDNPIRNNAARALGKLKDFRAVELLIIILKNENPPLIRVYAAEALRNITGKDFGHDPEKWQVWWEENKAKY